MVKKRQKVSDKKLKLKNLLRDRDVEIRRDAVYNLKNFKDKSFTISLLVKSLEDSDWRVRKSAIDVLLGIKGNAVIRALVDTLYSENANARNSAIEALTSLGPEAIDYLIEAFDSSNSDVKKFIIDILGATGDLSTLPLVRKALSDRDENVRASAVEHLGNFQDVSALNALISVLKSGDIWLGFPAADALGKICREKASPGRKRAVNALISVLPQKDLRRPAIRALGQIAEVDSLSSIVPFLKDDSKAVCEEVIKAVERLFQEGVSGEVIVKTIKKSFGNEAVKILLPYAQSDKKEVRIASILLRGLLEDKKAIAPLLEISLEEERQETIIKVLVFMAKASPELLMPFFNSSDAYQRRVLCDIVSKVGDAIFFKPLITMLKDEDSHVRAKAALTLSQLKNPKAVNYIRPLLLDEYKDVQEAAIKALSILKRGHDMQEIIMGLSDKNPVLRRNSAVILGLIREKSAVEALGIALKDSDVNVRVAVVDAIGHIDGDKAVKYLLLALTDESPDVRRVAVIAIGNMQTKKCVEPLILLLSDSDVWVRATAAKELGYIKDKRAVEPLINLLSDDSGVVKTAAIEALGNFKVERVKNALLSILTDEDDEVRSTAIESLSIFEGIIEDIIPLLKDKDKTVRKKAVDLLGRFFKDESYLYLKEIADTDNNTEVREAAARYLNV